MKKYIITLLLLLISCNTVEEPNIIKFSTGRGVPIVHVLINGKGANLLIDTGASQSIIDLTAKDDYDFKVTVVNQIIEGVGGDILTYQVYGTDVRYKDSLINIDFKAADIENIRKKLGVVGIIGSDYLDKNNLTINFNNKTITRQ